MLTIAERHKYILEQLNKNGFVSVADIAAALDVTVVTVRKDLKALEEKNLLYRTHGSASPVNPNVPDVHVLEKEKVRRDEKEKIGSLAVTLIEPDDAIIIASGSTIDAFVRKLNPASSLNVVTPSLRVAFLLNGYEKINILMLGGYLNKKSMSVRGEFTSLAFEEFTCSKLFIGVDGIDSEYGITTSNIEEARLTRRMMAAASKTIVLADSSKFSQRGFGRICGLDSIDTIITDSGVSDAAVNMVEEMGVKILIAE